MSYETFKSEMAALLADAGKYQNQAGERWAVEKMAKLADAYPEHDRRLEMGWGPEDFPVIVEPTPAG